MKITAISQKTISNAFSWMKLFDVYCLISSGSGNGLLLYKPFPELMMIPFTHHGAIRPESTRSRPNITYEVKHAAVWNYVHWKHCSNGNKTPLCEIYIHHHLFWIQSVDSNDLFYSMVGAFIQGMFLFKTKMTDITFYSVNYMLDIGFLPVKGKCNNIIISHFTQIHLGTRSYTFRRVLIIIMWVILLNASKDPGKGNIY